jgi:hypothetical protein
MNLDQLSSDVNLPHRNYRNYPVTKTLGCLFALILVAIASVCVVIGYYTSFNVSPLRRLIGFTACLIFAWQPPNILGARGRSAISNYYVYENWAHKRTRIDVATCSFCNHGPGTQASQS